jgi:hypothetical protein
MVQAKASNWLTKDALLSQLQAQRALYMQQTEALQRVLEKQIELTGSNPLRKEMVAVRPGLVLSDVLFTSDTCTLTIQTCGLTVHAGSFASDTCGITSDTCS